MAREPRLKVTVDATGAEQGARRVKRSVDDMATAVKGLSAESKTGVRAFDDVIRKAGSLADAFSKVKANLGLVAALLPAVVAVLAGGALIAGIVSLTGALFRLGDASVDAAAKQRQILRVLTAASSGDVAAARDEYAFITKEVDRLGLQLESAASQYAKFTAATRGTVLEGEASRRIFVGVSEAVSALGLSSEQAQGAFTALEQIVSKGRVSAEELRGQLGERIPGAFLLAAKSIGVTTAELDKMLQTGELTAAELLPKLADELHRVYGPQALTAAQEYTAQTNRLENALFNLRAVVGDELLPEVTSLVSALSDFARSEDAVEFAGNLGHAMANAVSGVNSLIGALVKLKPPLEYLNRFNTEGVRRGFSMMFGAVGISATAAAEGLNDFLRAEDTFEEKLRRSLKTFAEARAGLARLRLKWDLLSEVKPPPLLTDEEIAKLAAFTERALPDHQRKVAELTRRYEALKRELGDLPELTRAYQEQLAGLNRAQQIEEEKRRIVELIAAERDAIEQRKKSIDEIKKSYEDLRDAWERAEQQLDELLDARHARDPLATTLAGPLGDPIAALPPISREQWEADIDWGVSLFLSEMEEANRRISRDLALRLHEDVGAALASAIASAIRGGETDIGGAFGSALGAAIGGYFGGPQGAAIGSAIGERLLSSIREFFVNAASLDISGGRAVGSARPGFSRLADDLEAGLQEILDALGGVVDALPSIRVRVSNSGKGFSATVAGVYVGTFETVSEALGAAARRALVGGRLFGVSQEVEQALRLAGDRTAEELVDLILFAQRVADLRTGAGETAVVIRDLANALENDLARAASLGIGGQPLVEEFIRDIEEIRRQILGLAEDELSIRTKQAEDLNRSLREKLEQALREQQQLLDELNRIMQKGAQDAFGSAGQAILELAGKVQLLGDVGGKSAVEIRNRLAELALLIDAIPTLLIDPNQISVGGGGGQGARRRDLRDQLRSEADLFGVEGVERQFLDAERAFQDWLKRLEEARFSTEEHADLLRRAAEQREREMAAIREGVERRVEDFARTGPAAALQQQLAELGRTYQQLVTDVAALNLAHDDEARLLKDLEAGMNARLQALHDEAEASTGSLMAALLEAAGRTEEAAQLRWELEVAAYQLQIERLAAERELLGLDNAVIDRMRALLGEIVEAGPPQPDVGTGGGGGGGGDFFGGNAYEDWQRRLEAARDTLQGFLDLALNPFERDLRDLNETFDELRAVLGNTAEVQRAYNLALQDLQDRYLSGLQDFYDSITGGPLSQATGAQQVSALMQRFSQVQAAVAGGDLSQAQDLAQIGQQLLQLYGQTYGTAGGGYAQILAQIQAAVGGILGIPGSRSFEGFLGAAQETRADVVPFPGANSGREVVAAIGSHAAAELGELRAIRAAIEGASAEEQRRWQRGEAAADRRSRRGRGALDLKGALG